MDERSLLLLRRLDVLEPHAMVLAMWEVINAPAHPASAPAKSRWSDQDTRSTRCGVDEVKGETLKKQRRQSIGKGSGVACRSRSHNFGRFPTQREGTAPKGITRDEGADGIPLALAMDQVMQLYLAAVGLEKGGRRGNIATGFRARSIQYRWIGQVEGRRPLSGERCAVGLDPSAVAVLALPYRTRN